MAYVPNSGSVVAFQGTVPFSVIGTTTGSVISVQQGSVATVIIGGSIAASFTPPANQSVSGNVGIVGNPSISGTVLVNNGSVVAFQGAAPWANTNVGSIITASQGSVAAVIIGGSVAVASPANQSVSGTVNTLPLGTIVTSLVSTVPSSVLVGSSIFGQLPAGTAMLGSVATYQGTVPWAVAGSVASFAVGNASLITVPQSSTAVVIIGGSVATATTNSSVMLLNSANTVGSVIAYQGTVPWAFAGSVASFMVGNASMITVHQGSVAAVIIGGSIATATTNSSVFLLNSPNTIGSVVAYQGLASWNVSGSVAAFQAGTNITSLVSTVPSSVLVGASIFGQVPVTRIANTIPASALSFLGATSSVTANIASTITVLGYSKAILQLTSAPSMTATVIFQGSADNSSWRPITGYNTDTNALASITTVADANWVFDVAGLQTFRALIPSWTAGSITGKVYLSPEDARPQAVYVSNSTPSSLLTGASIIGLTPVNVTNTNLNVGGSLVSFQGGTWSTSVMTNVITSIATAGQVMGSVAALQATNPWNVAGSVAAFLVGNASVITVPQMSSVLAVPVGSVIAYLQAPSIVGTYAEDAASASGDKGFFVMGARNDTLASVTSTDGDYSSHVVGPAGELIAENAPLTKWVSGTASMLGGVPLTTSVTVIAAQGSSIFTYITGVQVVNLSASSVLVSFGAATSSLIAYTIAPPGGGSNIYYQNGLKTNANAAFSASVSGAASVYISAQGFISKT